MKKAFPANINGKIFYIDEDAYTLLHSYLTQLRAAFPGPEGEEIVSDIESRIRELFDERIAAGQSVIVIDDVNSVIDIMGRPEEISGSDEAEYNVGGPATPPPYQGPVKKHLYRDERNKVFGGVLSGLGLYLGWDVTVLRILAVVLAVCTYFWPCVLIYLVAWMVIPPARTPRQILEMQGQPVNIKSVGQTVVDTASGVVNGAAQGAGNFINSFFQIVGIFLVGFFGFIGAMAAATTIIIALCIIAGMVCLSIGAGSGLLAAFDISMAAPYLEGWGMTLVMLAVALPMLALTWAGCSAIFKAPSIPKGVVITGIIFEVLFIVAAAVLLNIGEGFDTSDLVLMSVPASMFTLPAA